MALKPGRPPGTEYFPRLDEELKALAGKKDEHGRYVYSSGELSRLMDVPQQSIIRRLKILGLNRPHNYGISKYDNQRDEIERRMCLRDDKGKLVYSVRQIARDLGLAEYGLQKYTRLHRIGPQAENGMSERARFQPNPRKPKADTSPPPRPLLDPKVSLPPLSSLQLPLPHCMGVQHGGD